MGTSAVKHAVSPSVRARVIMLVLVALASACTPPGETDSVGELQASSSPDGVLEVSLQVRLEGRLYVEGAIPFVEVLDPSGDIIASARWRGGARARAVLRRPLTPGDYEVRTYLRPCGGNCGSLGEAADECLLPIEMPADGSNLVVRVRVVAVLGECGFTVNGDAV